MSKAGRYAKANQRAGRQGVKQVKRDREQGDYVAPPREDRYWRSWYQTSDDLHTVQLRVDIWTINGKLVDFALAFQVKNLDTWTTLVRADICHGHAHIHARPDQPDETVIHIARLDKQAQLNSAFSNCLAQIDEIGRTMRDTEASKDPTL